MQRFIVALLVLLSTASAFTPDAAFKRSQMGLSFGNEDQKKVFVYTQSTNDKRRRHAFVSTVDNLRKSVTNPPSFDEYMAVRRQQLNEIQPEEKTSEASPSNQ